MQGSVHTYDADSRSGSVLLDDGRELPFHAQAIDDSLLKLRVGQRVSLASVDPDAERPTLTKVWIVGIGAGQIIG